MMIAQMRTERVWACAHMHHFRNHVRHVKAGQKAARKIKIPAARHRFKANISCHLDQDPCRQASIQGYVCRAI